MQMFVFLLYSNWSTFLPACRFWSERQSLGDLLFDIVLAYFPWIILLVDCLTNNIVISTEKQGGVLLERLFNPVSHILLSVTAWHIAVYLSLIQCDCTRLFLAKWILLGYIYKYISH